MKKKLLFLSLLGLFCVFGINVNAQVYPENLLVDDFNDADLTLANWDGAVGASGWNTTWSANEGIDGGGCIKIVTGTGGFWNTSLGPWIVGHKYKISCMVKGAGNNASPLIFNLHGVSDIPNTPCPNAAEKEPFDACTVFPLTTTWQKQEATFVPTATTTPLFNITLWCFKSGYPCMAGWANPNATDETLVDNFQLIDLGPEKPVVVGEDLLVDNFNDADLTLANWDGAVGASGWNTEWSATEGRDGTGCIKILTGTGGFWNTSLGPWPVDHKFKVSCWVKGAGNNASPVIFDFHGVNDKPNTPCNNNLEKEAFDTCTVYPLTSEWKLQEATFITRATTAPLFNLTVWCFKGGYPCMAGWANPNATDASLIDDFKLTDLGPVSSTTGIKPLQSKAPIYISDNKLRNVDGLVSIYDVMGRLVFKSYAHEGTVSVASVKKGIYIVHANNSSVKIVR